MARSRVQSSESQECALLRRIADQDRQALEELYNAYHRRLCRFLLRLAPRYDFAEEVINDTFWVVWTKAGEFRGASRVSTWIMGIAYRRALRALRDERQLALAEGPPAGDTPSDENLAETTGMQDWIAQGLRGLPDEQR